MYIVYKYKKLKYYNFGLMIFCPTIKLVVSIYLL